MQDRLCLDKPNLKNHLQNQIAFAKWSMKVDALLDYYEKVTPNK